MKKLIALHGFPGCGKDTFANRLIESGGWQKVSFAAPLKRMISVGLNIPMEDIENPNVKNLDNYKFGRSIRYMAQTLGTEWGRELINENIWLDLATESIKHAWSLNQKVINTDLRFENEAERIKELGGKIIHIVRETGTYENAGVANHSSNNVLPNKYIDYTIYNNWSIEEFYRTIDRFKEL